MAIKNYTSTVGVYQSLGGIQEALARHGARKVMIEYAPDGMPEGVTFALETSVGTRGFRLPANIAGVRAVFKKQGIKDPDGQQAQRTAWKNVHDWVQAQMAFVEAGNASMEQLFLHGLTGKSGVTLYELYEQGRLMLGSGADG